MLARQNVLTAGKANSPLKGLLMDKGREAVEEKLSIILHKYDLVVDAMANLVELQRASREAAGVDCADLYLQMYLKPEFAKNPAYRGNPRAVPPSETRGAPGLEWRAIIGLARKTGCAYGLKLKPFVGPKEHVDMVRDYVMDLNPDYYNVMIAQETVRQTLNVTAKTLRKMMYELGVLLEEGEGLPQHLFESQASLSRRLLSEVDESGEVARLLQDWYAREVPSC